jgi:hypothetical protein
MRGECRIAKTSVESHSIGTIPLLALHASRFVLRSGIGAVQSRVRGLWQAQRPRGTEWILQGVPGRLSMQNRCGVPSRCLARTGMSASWRPPMYGLCARSGTTSGTLRAPWTAGVGLRAETRLAPFARSNPTTAFEAVSLQRVVALVWRVGRAPRPAGDALVGLLGSCRMWKSRTGGPARIRGSAPQQLALRNVRAPCS